jgi:hypothetical protein
MNIDIQAAEDDFFKMSVVKFGEQHLASNGENIAIAPTPEEAIEKVVEQSQPQPVEIQSGPRGAPINNKVYGGTGWFEGTPWSTNNR